MTVLTISGKKLDNGVNYIPFKKELLHTENKLTFMIENLKQEVMQGDYVQQTKNIKKLKKMYKRFISLLGVGTVTAMTTAFLPLTASAQNQVLETPTNVEAITPPVVMEWGITLALITVAVGVALSGSLMAIAGIYRMFRKRKEAEDWTVDIVKGLVQVLVAVPVVYSLFYLAQLIFRNLPMLEGLL